jgi:hypothetical protein
MEQLCSATFTCAPGCDTDAKCNQGRICNMGMCQNGCRATNSCPLNQYCDPMTMACKMGCQDQTHCDLGTACVMYQDGSTACNAGCYGNYTCNDSTWDCFMAIYNDTITPDEEMAARCRKKCGQTSDCPSGYICTWFATDASAPNGGSAQYCAKPCTISNYCAGTVQDIINPVGTCQCQTDGTCHVTDLMSSICYIVDGSAGI